MTRLFEQAVLRYHNVLLQISYTTFSGMNNRYISCDRSLDTRMFTQQNCVIDVMHTSIFLHDETGINLIII